MSRYLVRRHVESVDLHQTIGIVDESEVSVNTPDEAAMALAIVKEAYSDRSISPRSRDEHTITELGDEAVVYPWADDAGEERNA